MTSGMAFTKMHGAGNDFVVVDATGGADRDWSSMALTVCDRHFGVGADGLILAAPPVAGGDLRMRMFNPDGSEAEMCGNGIRCLVKFAVERELVRLGDGRVLVETGAGLLTVETVLESDHVVAARVSMGRPRLAPSEIPVLADVPAPVRNWSLAVDGQSIAVTCVSMGNPHAVHLYSRPVDGYPLERLGPLVEHHPAFPNRVNFEVARVLSRDSVEARVWERGAGLTLACGSGAAAVMVAARLNNLVDDAVDVRLPGGVLRLEWDGEGEVYLTGPAVEVFTGVWPG